MFGMRSQLLRCRFAAWAALAALIVAGSARAEFTPGAVLPEFTLKAADGSTFSLTREGGTIVVTLGAKRVEPEVLLMHVFQPDCLQCQAQMLALESLHHDFANQRVLIVGIAHRGDLNALRAIGRQLKVTFPLLAGTGSAVATQFAAGDTMGIADRRGAVQFAQVDYGQGDEKVWRDSVGLLLAGKPLTTTTISRERLQIGDRLPLIELPSLTSGKTVALTGEGGRLTWRDETGRIQHPKAVVGMFSRY